LRPFLRILVEEKSKADAEEQEAWKSLTFSTNLDN
jgi:hypothetical protein